MPLEVNGTMCTPLAAIDSSSWPVFDESESLRSPSSGSARHPVFESAWKDGAFAETVTSAWVDASSGKAAKMSAASELLMNCSETPPPSTVRAMSSSRSLMRDASDESSGARAGPEATIISPGRGVTRPIASTV